MTNFPFFIFQVLLYINLSSSYKYLLKNQLHLLLELSSVSRMKEKSANFRSGYVTIIGNPNVGKSTLINAFLKQPLSIASAKPQTTRHRILGIVTNEESQIIFSDTPGVMSPAYALQQSMMDSVRESCHDADMLLFVTDIYGEGLNDHNLTRM
jgi:predicted GTPase